VQRSIVVAVVCLAVLAAAAAASATERHAATIEPSERVHGMLVVQGTPDRASTSLFGTFCRPDIVRSGRYHRSCLPVPRVDRLFVGPGLFATGRDELTRAWAGARWSVWIDGERVRLDAFGATDRMLYRYPPADGRDVILREWSLTLVRPTPGRHTIRYHVTESGATVDATWRFTVWE
jgi:hypothetical protein